MENAASYQSLNSFVKIKVMFNRGHKTQYKTNIKKIEYLPLKVYDEYNEWTIQTFLYKSQCQNSSKFLSVSYLMKTADVIMNFFSSHNTTDHT